MRVVESGPLRASLEIRRRILNSVYVQRISLAYNSPRLDFDTSIDWQERHILLKTAFPVQVLSPVASYEIQWGNVQRPTHRNTSWDWARFETCAHKWVDLSEGGYGVSLLNDCKYGHDIHDNVMRISLLRGTTMPDPQADLGEHRFAYSLLPHAGSWDENTIAAAYALNDPLRVYLPETASQAAPAVKPHSLIACNAPNVVIETVKRAEDGNGLIVRLYEAQRKRGPVRLQASFPLKEAWRANLLEENEERLEVEQAEIRLQLPPYQIAPLRLENRNNQPALSSPTSSGLFLRLWFSIRQQLVNIAHDGRWRSCGRRGRLDPHRQAVTRLQDVDTGQPVNACAGGDRETKAL